VRSSRNRSHIPPSPQARLRSCRELAQRFHPPSGVSGAVSSLWGALSGEAPPELSAVQVDALLVSAESSLLMSLTHLLSESTIGFVKCGLDIRSGWSLYRQADAAIGNMASAVGEQAMRRYPVAPLPARVGIGAVGGVCSEFTSTKRAEEALPVDADLMALIGLPLEEVSAIDKYAEERSRHGVMSDIPGATSLSMDQVRSSLAGILFGMGAFNIVGSVLPPTIIKLIEMLGFPASR
jgi:hypothetical protein